MFLSRLILTALSLWSPCQWVSVRDVVGTRAEVSSLLRVQTTGEGIKIYIQVSVGISGAPWAQLVTPTVSRGQCELSHQSQQTCGYSYPSSHGSSMSSWLSSPQKSTWKAHLVPIPPLNSTTVSYRVLGASHVKRIFFFGRGWVCVRDRILTIGCHCPNLTLSHTRKIILKSHCVDPLLPTPHKPQSPTEAIPMETSHKLHTPLLCMQASLRGGPCGSSKINLCF